MTTAQAFSLDHWNRLADYVMAVLVGEQTDTSDNAHYWRSVEYGLMAYHMPPGLARDTFRVVSELIQTEQPVHFTSVTNRLNGHGQDPRIYQWFALYGDNSTLTGNVFTHNMQSLMEIAERARAIEALDTARQKLESGADFDNTVHATVSSLSQTGVDKVENETAALSADDFVAFMSELPPKKLLTGVRQIDDWTGGITPASFTAIVAPFKQRKTSLVLNLLLNMARHGISVALMMFEADKRKVVAQVVSMLAIEYVITKGWYDSVGERDLIPIKNISADNLRKVRAGYRAWDAARVEAIDYAIAEWRRIGRNFRIYDRTRTGGSLSDEASIYRMALRDKLVYKTDFIAIDHLQRIGHYTSDYERIISVAPYLEALARREEIAVCLLAQLKVEHAEGLKNQHASGTRGGTALDEAVDTMFITGYKQKIGASPEHRYPDDRLMVGLQLNRDGAGGPHMRSLLKIDPASGLVLDDGVGIPIKEYTQDE